MPKKAPEMSINWNEDLTAFVLRENGEIIHTFHGTETKYSIDAAADFLADLIGNSQYKVVSEAFKKLGVHS